MVKTRTIDIGSFNQSRFWNKVDKNGDGGCWIWTGSKDKFGYGRMGIKRRPFIVHRISWTLANGDIPDGMVIDHICHNPSCVNPDHLRPCSQHENILNSTHHKDNKCGFKGVQKATNYNGYIARIQINGKKIYIGSYETAEEAYEEYKKYSLRLHGVFSPVI